jgi:hypothetical protein
MTAPGRGTSFKDVITDFLQQHDKLWKSEKEFLQRLRKDDDRCIGQIWKVCTTKGFFPDTPDGRLTFVERLCEIWGATIFSDLVAIADAEDRNTKLKLKASGVLVSKIVTDKAVPREVKAELLSKAGVFFKEARWCSDIVEQHKWLSVRSDRDGTRRHTAFMRTAAAFFREATGQWHDKWTADLATLAFPDHRGPKGHKDFTVDMVISARRGMSMPKRAP